MSELFEELRRGAKEGDVNNDFDRKDCSPSELVDNISGAFDRLHEILSKKLMSEWSGESFLLHCERERGLFEDASEALKILRGLCQESEEHIHRKQTDN